MLPVDDGVEPSASGPTADGTWSVPVSTSAEPSLATVKMRSCRPAASTRARRASRCRHASATASRLPAGVSTVTVAPVDRIIAAQAIEIDRQHAVSCDRDQLEILRHRLGTRRARSIEAGRRGRMVLAFVSVCSWSKQQPATVPRGRGRDGRWKRAWKNPSRSEWTPWSCDQSPVARRSARMDYEKDFGGLAGASGSMPARVGGAGTMMSSAFERGGQPGSGSANVIGTQHGQPDAQQPPLQAGARAALVIRCRRSELGSYARPARSQAAAV